MTELKPCPFCGNEPYIVGVDRYYALCPHCSTASRLYSTKQEAIEAWNTRFEPTCKRIRTTLKDNSGWVLTCSECGNILTVSPHDGYCSHCGRKIEE